MRSSSVTASDRRQTPRTKLADIAYIGMGTENGGLVLDVSDGGLSFHSVAPVQAASTIRFLLSLRGHSRIEGAGQVVWTNELRTVCGLKFTSLSAGALEHLNNWTNRPPMPPVAREKAPPPAVATREVAPAVPAAPRQKASVAAVPVPPKSLQTKELPVSLASQSAAKARPVFAIPPARKVYLSEPEAGTLWQKPLFLWTMFGLLAAALTVTAYIYGVQVGKTQISSVARFAPDPVTQSEPSAAAPNSTPASSTAIEAASTSTGSPAALSESPSVARDVLPAAIGGRVNTSMPNDIPGNAVQRSGAAGLGAKVPDQHAEMASEAGKSELTAAMADLNGDNGHRDMSSGVRLLWAAVGNGNSTAEVILADLYINGDGVAKSCDQGRVLLTVATKSGNALAKMKLDELNANGCP
jgi:hypothetical protein